jgi:hypothetical protein
MKNEILDDTPISMDGHVLITDMDSGEVLLDKHNATRRAKHRRQWWTK